jgi:hypothetical protein
MPFYHTLTFSATLEADPIIKDNKWDKNKNDVSLRVSLDPQNYPDGANGFKNNEVSKGVWVNMEFLKTAVMPDFLKSGARVLLNARLTGGTKDAGAPKAYYIKASEVIELTGKGTVNQFTGRGKIFKVAECPEIPGATKLLIKEPKRAFGDKKPDYQTNAGYHFYTCIANAILPPEIYKEGAYFVFQGKLAKGIFDISGADDETKKRLSQPTIILEKGIY